VTYGKIGQINSIEVSPTIAQAKFKNNHKERNLKCPKEGRGNSVRIFFRGAMGTQTKEIKSAFLSWTEGKRKKARSRKEGHSDKYRGKYGFTTRRHR